MIPPRPSAPAQTQGPAGPASFRVGYVRYATAKYQPLSGRGSLSIGGGVVGFRLRQSLSFWGGRVNDQVAWRVIANVEQRDAIVSFEVAHTGRKIVLKAGSIEEAARIVSQLPSQVVAPGQRPATPEQEFAATLRKRTPRAVIAPALVGINIAFFVLTIIGGAHLLLPDVASLQKWGANFWPLTSGGQWWRLLTSTFVHVGVGHLLVNMATLAAIGPMTERLYGRSMFAGIYLAAGIVGSLASCAWQHNAVSAGASGAILGVVGMLLAYALIQWDSLPTVVDRALITRLLSFLGLLGYNVFLGSGGGGIDNFAHGGGLVAGFGLGLLCARPLEAGQRRREWGWRSAVGGAVAAGVIAGGVLALPKCTYDVELESRFRAEWPGNRAAHQTISREYECLASDLTRGVPLEHGPQLKQRLKKLLPLIDQLAQRISAYRLTAGSPSQRVQEAMLRYLEIQGQSAQGMEVVCHRESLSRKDASIRGVVTLHRELRAAAQALEVAEKSLSE